MVRSVPKHRRTIIADQPGSEVLTLSSDDVRLWILTRSAVHEGVAEAKPDQRTEADVENVLQQDRLARYCAAYARFKQSEASVHEPGTALSRGAGRSYR